MHLANKKVYEIKSARKKNRRKINIQAPTIQSMQYNMLELPYPPKTHFKKAKNHLICLSPFFCKLIATEQEITSVYEN